MPKEIEIISPSITKLVQDIFALLYLKYPKIITKVLKNRNKLV
jgi:hypothetical protein